MSVAAAIGTATPATGSADESLQADGRSGHVYFFSIGRQFSKGVEQITSSATGKRPTTTSDLVTGADTSLTIPGRLLEFAKGIGNVIAPWTDAAGNFSGDAVAALAHGSGELTDEALDKQIAYAKDLKQKLGGAAGASAEVGALQFQERLRAMPYNERIELSREAAHFAGETMAGLAPGVFGVAKGVSKAASVLSRARLEKGIRTVKGIPDSPIAGLGDAPDVLESGSHVTAGLKNAMDPGDIVKQAERELGPSAKPDQIEARINELSRVPSPNTARMGVADSAKNIITNINRTLQDEGKLARGTVQTHEQTIEAAKASRFRNVEDVLAHDDTQPLNAADRTAARAVRDESLKQADFLVQRVLAGEEAAGDAMRGAILGMGRISQKVTNIETATARAQEAGNIVSDAALAGKFDVKRFGDQVAALGDELPADNLELAQMFSKMANAEQKAKLAERISQQPSALWDIFYGLNLLSSPATHIANLVGNSVAVVTSVPTRLAGEFFAPIFRGLGSKTQHVAPGETLDLVHGMLDSVGDALRAARTSWREGHSTLEGSGKAGEMLMSTPSAAVDLASDAGLYAKFLDTMATLTRGPAAAGRFVMHGMSSTDEFFKVLQYNGELRALARREAYASGARGADRVALQKTLMDNPSDTMLAGALAHAKEQTFTKEFAGDTAGMWATKLAGSTVARLTVTPFFRTPVRLLEYGSVHTPGLNFFAKQFYSDIAAGGAKAELAAAKLAVGAGIMASTAALTVQGYMTGAGPTDPKLRKHMEDAGWQQFSVYSPATGKYYSYKSILAVLPMIGAAATAAEMAPEMKDHEWGTIAAAAVIATARGALDHPFWQGASDFSDAVAELISHGTTDPAEKFLARRVLSLFPGSSALRYASNVVDPRKRDPKATGAGEGTFEGLASEFQMLLKSFQAQTPGWSLSLPAHQNVITGEPIMRPASFFGLNPFTTTTQTKDPVLLEVAALDGAGIPPEVPRVINGTKPSERVTAPSLKEGIRLSEQERGQLTTFLTTEKMGGKTLHEQMAAMIASPEYQRQSDHGKDGGKAYLLQGIFNVYLDVAEEKLRRENPALDQIVVERQRARILQKMPPAVAR